MIVSTPFLDKIEKTQFETTEKQLASFEKVEKAILSMSDGFASIQDTIKKSYEVIETLSKKQDVTSAVIDKRGDGIEKKIELFNELFKTFTKSFTEQNNKLSKSISEILSTSENYIKPIEKILIDSNNNRKEESQKMVENLSVIPDRLNTYLDSNKEILNAIKNSELSIGNISKSIENLTKTIIENEKKKEKKEIIESAQNHLSRGVILFYRSSFGAAEKEIRKAIELKSDFAEAYLNLGMVLGEIGKTEQAIKNIKKSLEIEPGLEEAYNNLGAIQLRGEKYEEAVESFNEAIKLGFKYPVLYLNMAQALIGLDRINEAIDFLKKVTEIDPTNVEAKEILSKYHK